MMCNISTFLSSSEQQREFAAELSGLSYPFDKTEPEHMDAYAEWALLCSLFSYAGTQEEDEQTMEQVFDLLLQESMYLSYYTNAESESFPLYELFSADAESALESYRLALLAAGQFYPDVVEKTIADVREYADAHPEADPEADLDESE